MAAKKKSAKKKAAKKKGAKRKPAKFEIIDGVPNRGGKRVANLIAVLIAISPCTDEFSTRQVMEATGLSYTSVISWLAGLQQQGVIEGWLDHSRCGRGDYRWRNIAILTQLRPKRVEKAIN